MGPCTRHAHAVVSNPQGDAHAIQAPRLAGPRRCAGRPRTHGGHPRPRRGRAPASRAQEQAEQGREEDQEAGAGCPPRPGSDPDRAADRRRPDPDAQPDPDPHPRHPDAGGTALPQPRAAYRGPCRQEDGGGNPRLRPARQGGGEATAPADRLSVRAAPRLRLGARPLGARLLAPRSLQAGRGRARRQDPPLRLRARLVVG